MNIYAYIGLFIGVLSGIIFILLYFSMNKGWAGFSSTAGPGVILFAIINLLKDNGTIFTAEVIGELLKFYLGSYVITVIAAFIILLIYLNNKEDSPYKVTVVHFLLCDRVFKKDFFDTSKQLAEKSLKMSEAKKIIAEANEKVKESDEKEKELKRQVSILKQKEVALNKTIENEGIYLQLPYNHKMPVDVLFMNELPNVVNNLTKFCGKMDRVLDEAIKQYRKGNDKSQECKELTFIDFIEKLCYTVSNNLFNPQEVRVHFRYLTKYNTYNKLVAVSENDIYCDEMKILNCNEGMISAAGKCKRSLIKSLNHHNHCPGSNDGKWVEYITLVFPRYFKNGKPQLSMGIDVTNYDRYKNELYFLNYCKFEEIIQRFLVEIDNEISINKIIENKIIS